MKKKTFTTKPFKELLEKRLTKEEIEEIKQEAFKKAEAFTPTIDLLLASLSRKEKEDFYLEHLNCLADEFKAVVQELKKLK